MPIGQVSCQYLPDESHYLSMHNLSYLGPSCYLGKSGPIFP